MTPVRLVAWGQVATGWLLARHPSRALRVLGYPYDRPLPRATVRVLGARQLVQGVVELRSDPRVMWAGAGVDALHAASCLAYARRSESGQRAALRSAAMALAFAAAQAAVAARAASNRPTPQDSLPPSRPGPSAAPDLPWVGSARAAAWPQPSEDGQQVLVGSSTEMVVALRGGVMDGALVAVPPGAQHYDVVDSDRGPQRYTATTERTEEGFVVFTREEDAQT